MCHELIKDEDLDKIYEIETDAAQEQKTQYKQNW